MSDLDAWALVSCPRSRAPYLRLTRLCPNGAERAIHLTKPRHRFVPHFFGDTATAPSPLLMERSVRQQEGH